MSEDQPIITDCDPGDCGGCDSCNVNYRICKCLAELIAKEEKPQNVEEVDISV